MKKQDSQFLKISLFYLTNSPKPLNIQFTVTYGNEKQQMVSCEKLEPKNYWNNESIIKIVGLINQSFQRYIGVIMITRFRVVNIVHTYFPKVSLKALICLIWCFIIQKWLKSNKHGRLTSAEVSFMATKPKFNGC